jgi:hypothetical protein
MSGFMLLHEAMLYMYAADATIAALAQVDAVSSEANNKRLEELCLWLGHWRAEEINA